MRKVILFIATSLDGFIARKDGSIDWLSFVSSDIVEFVRDLKSQKGKNIWLVGGGQINTLLLNAGLIDEIIVSIHPIILGQGLPVFAGNPREIKFHMADKKTFKSGQITYHKT
jgi:dihydrofolate reductase